MGLGDQRSRITSPSRVAQRLIDFAGHPQAKKKHGELAGDGNYRPLLGRLAPAFGQSETPPLKIAVRAEASEDVMGAFNKQRS